MNVSSPISLLNSQNLGKNKLRAAATQFVSILLSQMFDKMEESVVKSSVIPQTSGERWYREWLMDAYSQEATSDQLNSLVNMVVSQLSQNQYQK